MFDATVYEVPDSRNVFLSPVYYIFKNKWYHAKVLLKRFYLSGHIIGFHSDTPLNL